MRRRLLQGFQKRIERAVGQHMHLIDDIHALFHFDRHKRHFFAQIADIVHAVVGSGVHFDDVIRAVERPARPAHATRVAVLRIFAIDSLRQNFGTGGFARAARAAEKIRVRNRAVHHFAAQNLGNMLLSDDIRKHVRPPFAV